MTRAGPRGGEWQAGVSSSAMTGHGARDLRVDLQPHPAGLRVHVTGANTLANTIAYWTRVLRAVRERPRPILLVDELIGPPLTGDDWLLLVGTMAATELTNVRIAHVKPRGLDALEFCELHAGDAGFDARVFVDEAEASRWLRFGEGMHADHPR